MNKSLFGVGVLFVVFSLCSCQGQKATGGMMTETENAIVSENTVVSENKQEICVSNAMELQKALDDAKPGDTISLREGIYEGNFVCTQNGTQENPITIKAYPGECAVITIPKGGSGAALCTNGCQYLDIGNLSFMDLKAKEVYGILMTGGEAYITVHDCEFARIETTKPGGMDKASGEANAILLLAETQDAISHVVIDGNQVHDNINGWSENISVAGNCEYIYVTNNEIHDCTNIGIDFYGNAEYCSVASLDQPRNCECTGNVVYRCESFYAQNAGIYVDGAYDILISDNEVYDNPYGIEIGSEEWREYYTDEKRVHGICVTNNSIHNNKECGLRIGGWTNDVTTGMVTDCEVTGNRFKQNGTEILLAKCQGIRFDQNEFADGRTCEEVIEYDDEIWQ